MKAFATVASLIAATIPVAAHAELPATVRKLLQDRNIPIESVAALVLRPGESKPVFSYRANASMQPASTIKLVTALVALDHLGPTYRGRAELLTHAPIENGVLNGDLILRGVGNVDFDWEQFAKMIETLKIRHGIRHIAGDLIVDRTFFHPSRPDLGQPRFDESVEFRYNVIPDALLVNHNLLQIEFDSDGERVSTRVTPRLDRVAVAPEFRMIDAPCPAWEDGWQEPTRRFADDGTVTLVLRGTFPRNCRARTEVNVLDRVLYVDRLFRALWAAGSGDLRGSFHGTTRDVAESASQGARLLAEHRSRPLSEVVRDVNKRSDNTFTRMLYLTLGELPPVQANGLPQPAPAQAASASISNAAPSPRETSFAKADAVVRAWFARHGIAADGLVLDNGSGLSRSERISAEQMGALLNVAYTSNWAPEFLASLPIVALDGTMRNRLRSSTVAGRARVKTGTLRNVVALAGYVPDATGRTVIAVVMINHENATSAVARPIVDAFIEWVGEVK